MTEMTNQEFQSIADKHLANFERNFREAQDTIRFVYLVAPIGSDREAGAKSVLNKMENVWKAFLHEFGPKD